MAKGSAALAAVAIILALVILGVFLINIALRDCNSNRDCPENAYCGSDYGCHEYPQKIMVEKNNLVLPALILGGSLILAAYLYQRKGKAGHHSPTLPKRS